MAQRLIIHSSPQRLACSALLPCAASTVVSQNERSKWQIRWSSHSPMGAPVSSSRKKVTLNTLRNLHQKQEPITMITAHDFPSAHVADAAGMDMILVGDSLAMVALGMDDTSEVVLEEMILHCRSVSRAAKCAFTVCPSLSSFMTLHAELIYRLATSPWVLTR